MAFSTATQAQTITDPFWSSPPNGDLTTNLMPGFASAIGVSGSALIRCRVLEDGHPFLCDAVSETVHGLGFGAAARLVAASGELRTRRVDGQPTMTSITTNVNFTAWPIDDRGKTWTGREPTPEGLRLAGQIFDKMGDEAGPSVEDMMEGLDFDRRAVVRPWIEELVLSSRERMREISMIQLARLFDEDALRDILAGKYPAAPSEDELLDACPEMTPKEVAALAELRRRYCSQYECGA